MSNLWICKGHDNSQSSNLCTVCDVCYDETLSNVQEQLIIIIEIEIKSKMRCHLVLRELLRNMPTYEVYINISVSWVPHLHTLFLNILKCWTSIVELLIKFLRWPLQAGYQAPPPTSSWMKFLKSVFNIWSLVTKTEVSTAKKNIKFCFASSNFAKNWMSWKENQI